MTIPAWQLISWRPVPVTLREFRRAVARMRPMGGAAWPGSEGRAGCRQGQALWAADHGGLPVGLAWEWSEVRDDVVALCDPMNVLSNVRLVDGAGQVLPASERMVHLNSAVHALGWQAHAIGPRAGWLQAMAA